ncbi:hypothetical protein BDZ97DRAFT_1976017 [Flammula alnicola]|nr:hypothetical protein BDZ97DRAFT_1976017 [Flammula alnicola]
MGTRGYKVYRRKGWYHITYIPCDSYPRVAGVAVLNEVARGDAYQKWLEGFRDSLDKELEELRREADDPEGKLDTYSDEEPGSYGVVITRKRPRNDIFIEWMYEIDTDNEIFHVSEELVQVYQSKHASGDIVTSLHQFDVILENPARCEMVAVEKRMTEVEAEPRYIPIPTKDSSWRWLREDLCVLWATRLGDEANMQAAVADLFTRVTQAPPKAKTIVYGIVISLFHVVIVRVDLSISDGSFKHTAALQFLPSFYAQSPSTLGISAVIRLGYALLCRDLDNLPYSPAYLGNMGILGASLPTLTSLACYPSKQPSLRVVGSAETNVPDATQVAQGQGMVREEVIELEESDQEYEQEHDYDHDKIPNNWDLYSAAFKIESDRDLKDKSLELSLPSPSSKFDIICNIHEDEIAFNNTFRRC